MSFQLVFIYLIIYLLFLFNYLFLLFVSLLLTN